MKKFIEGFKQFVVDTGKKESTAKSYESYLNGACKRLPGIRNHMELIENESNVDAQARLAEQIRIAIQSERKSKHLAISEKTLSNYGSGVNSLIAYICAVAEELKSTEALTSVVLEDAIEYSRKDLRAVFLSRVKTQDRFSYSYGVFPARILGRISARHKIKLFDKMVEETKLLYGVSKDKFFYLNEIDGLIINPDGRVYIEKDGKTYSLYTEVYKNSKFEGFEEATASTMKGLSLDHDFPMVEALEKAIKTMPEYQRLSSDIQRFKLGRKGSTAEISKAYYDSEYARLAIDEKRLMAEVVSFLSSVKLTVMKTSYNSSKSSIVA